jgi:DNA mismatch repair protein MutS
MEKDSEVENMLKEIDVNSLTPIDALNKLSELVQKIK